MTTDNTLNETTTQKSFWPKLFWLLLIIALIYFFFFCSTPPPANNTTTTRPTPETNREPESPTAYAEVQSLNTLSPSDELSAIEADLKSTNLDTLDKEMVIIENELGL